MRIHAQHEFAYRLHYPSGAPLHAPTRQQN